MSKQVVNRCQGCGRPARGRLCDDCQGRDLERQLARLDHTITRVAGILATCSGILAELQDDKQEVKRS